MSHTPSRREEGSAARRVDVEPLESRRVMCASCVALTEYLAQQFADAADTATPIVAPAEADAVAAVDGTGACGTTGGCCCAGCREAVAPGSAQSSADTFALSTAGLDTADAMRATRSATAVRKAAATVPQVWIEAPAYGIRGQNAVFNVSLDKEPGAKPVTVFFRTQNGGAAAGKDFTAVAGSLTFKGNETTKQILVPIKADAPLRAPKPADFSVILSPPPNGPANGKIVGDRAVTSIASDTPGFQIEINFIGNVPPVVQGAAKAAVNKWQSVIIGDLPSVVIGGKFIDDFVMNVKMGLLGGMPSDGEGGALANAFPMGPDGKKVAIRKDGSGNTAYMGTTGIDPSDTEFEGLTQVLMHEMGHALGIGAFWRYHLIPRLEFPDLGLIQGEDTDTPTYVGKNATAKYAAYFPGQKITSVPVQPFVLGHWDEDHLGTELMTPIAEEEPPMPLSDVTLGALADLGYEVNYSRREYWNPDGPLAGTGESSTGGGSGSSGDSSGSQFLTDIAWGFDLIVRRTTTGETTQVVAVANKQPAAEAPRATVTRETPVAAEQVAVTRRIVFRTAPPQAQRAPGASVAVSAAFRDFR